MTIVLDEWILMESLHQLMDQFKSWSALETWECYITWSPKYAFKDFYSK